MEHYNADQHSPVGQYRNLVTEWTRHAYIGTYFIALAAWWIFNIFRTCRKKGVQWKSQAYFSVASMSTIPAESIFKLSYMLFGIVMELIIIKSSVYYTEQIFAGQQASFYTALALNALFEIMQFKGYPVPEGAEVTTASLAFAMKAITLYYDYLPQSPLHTIVHMFLFYVAIFVIIAMFLETQYRNWVIPSLARAFFIMTYGTWSLHISHILLSSRSTWNPFNHDHIMLVTIFFPWHCFFNFALILLADKFVPAAQMMNTTPRDDVKIKPIITNYANMIFLDDTSQSSHQRT